MKEWKISFVNKDGELTSMVAKAEARPSMEEAAQLVRSKLYPVSAELDLNDFQDRVVSPTAKTLKTQHSVEITRIDENPKPQA